MVALKSPLIVVLLFVVTMMAGSISGEQIQIHLKIDLIIY